MGSNDVRSFLTKRAMIILLHSSKTMRFAPFGDVKLRSPQLLEKTQKLADYLKTLAVGEIAKSMKISVGLASKTHELIAEWNVHPGDQSLAIDTFVGDIYSGLQAQKLSVADRDYADKTLRILSGLYGIMRPYDAICPYRLEMGYKLPDPKFANLYKYWGDSIALCLPKQGLVVNLASEEFAKTVTSFIDESRVVVPKFLTVNKDGEPTFVVVHAKIARGAFARWLIMSRVDEPEDLVKFNDLGYRFEKKLSDGNSPVFVCEEFGGKGLSIK